jgi:proteasome lid subunit RPN8/RPN11
VANVAAEPARRFEMDPAGQVAALRHMRERGEGMLAIYHSHPSAPPEPSVHDLAGLGYPEALYLIISLNIKGVLEMRAWQREDDTMRERVLTILD